MEFGITSIVNNTQNLKKIKIKKIKIHRFALISETVRDRANRRNWGLLVLSMITAKQIKKTK